MPECETARCNEAPSWSCRVVVNRRLEGGQKRKEMVDGKRMEC